MADYTIKQFCLHHEVLLMILLTLQKQDFFHVHYNLKDLLVSMSMFPLFNKMLCSN